MGQRQGGVKCGRLKQVTGCPAAESVQGGRPTALRLPPQPPPPAPLHGRLYWRGHADLRHFGQKAPLEDEGAACMAKVQELGTGMSYALSTDAPRSILTEFDGSGNLIYVGTAAPGALSSEPVWVIRKLTYDGSGNIATILYAGGSPAVVRIWDNRAAYTYS